MMILYFQLYIELFQRIGETNVATIILSSIAITFLLIIKIHINERFQKKLPVPIPGELLIVNIVFKDLIKLLRLFFKYRLSLALLFRIS